MLNFVKHYGISQLKEITSALSDAIVKFDPEGATEAAISEMQENFDKVNKEFSTAKREWEREDLEAREIQKLHDQRMAAAELLQAQSDADPTNEKISNGLLKLLESLEEMQPDIDREREEADDSKIAMEQLDSVVKMYAEKLKTARSSFDKARRSMATAEREKLRQKEMAERASMAAGITKSGTGLSTALERMNKIAENAQDEASALKRKADLLTPVRAEDDDTVKAALAAVSGTVVTTAPLTAKDRLAALRDRQAA